MSLKRAERIGFALIVVALAAIVTASIATAGAGSDIFWWLRR